MAIRVLDQHTAELIAAGEVVERPSSVIKELVENALDAGAKSITVEIEKGGLNLMRIQDDGCGIPAAEVATAFLRHATSKIQTKDDLDSIGTLGFRGEALASIASVAKVQLLTKTQEGEHASLYSIAGGREEEMQPAARPVGTSIEVRDIFYNVPARMKFLKKDTSEGSFVTETLTRLALSRPEVSFKYIRDGKQIFTTPGDGKIESSVYAVLGAQFAKELASVSGGISPYIVNGLVTLPRAARASRSMQFFYINGRFVKNRTMMAALEQAYRGMLMGGKFPGGVLFLEMPTHQVDVNVHPAKTEVRFAKESDVFNAVYSAVKAALLQEQAVYSNFEFKDGEINTAQTVNKPDVVIAAQSISNNPTAVNVNTGGIYQKPETIGIKNYNNMASTLASDSSLITYQTVPYKSEYGLNVEPDSEDEKTGTVLNIAAQQNKTENVQQTILPEFEEEKTPLTAVGEVFKTYILCQRGDKICFIDKHAAHERIIYERLVAQRGKAHIQQLLEPVAITLSAAEKNALMQNKVALVSAGMEIEDFGGNGVLVRGVQSDIQQGSIEDWVLEIAGRLILNSKDTDDEKTDWVLHSVACRSAMKAGDTTPLQDLLELAMRILEGDIPPFCPHGRPVVIEITRKELEKQFGRLG